MRCPDTASCRGACRNNPDCTRAAGGRARAVEQADCREAREEADDARHDDETPVMLRSKTSQDSEHEMAYGRSTGLKYKVNISLMLTADN